MPQFRLLEEQQLGVTVPFGPGVGEKVPMFVGVNVIVGVKVGAKIFPWIFKTKSSRPPAFAGCSGLRVGKFVEKVSPTR